MRRFASAWAPRAAVVACLALAAAGCEDKPHASATSAASAAPSANAPLDLDPRLGAAVAAAASGAAPAGKPSGKAGDGPPESGVFGPGEADKLVARGAPLKVEVISDGAEPRVTVAPSIEPGGKDQKAKIAVSVRQGTGGRDMAMPTVEFTLALSADKPKEGEGTDVTAKVTKVAPAASQPGALPQGAAEALGKLKGSVVRFSLDKNGAPGGFATERAKGADKELDVVLRPLADALGLLLVPGPGKPVGVGATWMASDRASMLGLEVLRYRAIKVEKIDGDAVALSIDVRQYAADPKGLDNMGLPPGVNASLDAFMSQGKGDARYAGKTLLPASGGMKEQMQAQIRAGQQRGVIQGGLEATVVAP
jgi:hypothetical protein